MIGVVNDKPHITFCDAVRIAETLSQEDCCRVEQGMKPIYQTEEDFYAEHPQYRKQDCDEK